MPTIQTFGALVQFARKRAGLSQKQLADAAQLHSVTISNLERNRYSPDPATLRRIAEVLVSLQPERDDVTAALARAKEGGLFSAGTQTVREEARQYQADLPNDLRLLAAEFELEAVRIGANPDEMAYVRQCLESPETARMFSSGYVERAGVDPEAIKLDFQGLIDALRTYVKMRVARRSEAHEDGAT